jgi:hypothetical protein
MKKKRGIKINIQLSNRWTYFLIILGILAIVGVGIYAYGTSSPSTFGHSAGELSGVQKRVSGTCPSGQYMYGINSDGSVLCRNDVDTDTDTNTVGCNWKNWYCDCAADTSGGVEGAVVVCMYCDGGTVTALDVRQVYITTGNANCVSGKFPCSDC